MKLGMAAVGTALMLIVSVCQDIEAESGDRASYPKDVRGATAIHAWDSKAMATLRSLWIGSLPPLPADPTNAVADDPRAARLGQRLFFDHRLSANGKIACATCHQPERWFTDGLPLAQGVGVTYRKTMTIVGSAYSPWLFWDGRKDSLWAQALGPLESPVEHGGTRIQYVHLVGCDRTYRAEYEAVFGPPPDLSDRSRFPETAGPIGDSDARAAWAKMTSADRDTVTRVYTNLGKAIAAYERLILPGPSRFDAYVQALEGGGDGAPLSELLSDDEAAGLRLFIGKARCTRCHNGPLFTNNEFHNTGVPTAKGLAADHGRMIGVEQVQADAFNCLSVFSDGRTGDCPDLRFAKTGKELDGAFRTPALRNIAEAGPYMHAGQFATLREVLNHYNEAPQAPVGHSEIGPLRLSDAELSHLELFLGTLSSPIAASSSLLRPPTQTIPQMCTFNG